MYNDDMVYRHTREGSIMEHVIPKVDTYVHIRERWCECIPYANPDNIKQLIHNYYGPVEKTEFSVDDTCA